MNNVKKAILQLDRTISNVEKREPISFFDFMEILTQKPEMVIRNVFQVFHDMMKTYVGSGIDEYPDDPESINYIHYDCTDLFVKDSDNPFFADRLVANRLMNLTEAMKHGAQQNKIYIFEGPPGSGKSTFLNNLLKKFEEYTKTEQGARYETVWRLNLELPGKIDIKKESSFDQVVKLLSNCQTDDLEEEDFSPFLNENYIEIPCPSHDNPILLIPKEHRRAFLDDLFKNNKTKWKLFTEKENEWIFKENPCTICSSLYDALIAKYKNPMKVYEMIYARIMQYNRRLGEGISVFNPGDRPVKKIALTNPMLQKKINRLLQDSNLVKYVYSSYAKTNNGIFALMDIKNFNKERLIELHNIVSEGLHKVEDIEENVNSLFFALMNPEDKKDFDSIQSLLERIQYVNIPYILDWNTEVSIYQNIFGKHIEERFLPRILNNFARVIISTRLKEISEPMLEWIERPEKYSKYCDKNLQLLKMEIYSGIIPSWLSEEDRKRFNAKRRRSIIEDAETEGSNGFSGRDSIKIFGQLFSTYAKEDQLINMSILYKFFSKIEYKPLIPEGFLDSLVQMYNYTILQEVKESLYYYNEEQISKDIQNYLFSINFEPPTVEKCIFTNEKIEISEGFFESIELRLIGANSSQKSRLTFRHETQKKYTTKTMAQEIIIEGKKINETGLYNNLHERYVHNLKEKVLDPFLENENFRRAIKDYHSEEFKAYDKRIRDDVTFVIKNLCEKYKYNEKGAQEVLIYVIDNDLARKYNDT